MKILFVSKEFTPISNGTVTCLENILPYIAKKHSVTLYSNTSSTNSRKSEEILNSVIKRPTSIIDKIALIKLSILNNLKRRINNEYLSQLLSLGIKITFLPISILARRYGFISSYAWEKNLHKYIVKHENISDFDVVIAIANPISNLRAASNIKKHNKHLKLIIIQLDLYAYNPLLILHDKKEKDLFEERLKEELELYKTSDAILISNEMKETINSSKLSIYQNKIYPMAMPSLTGYSKDNSKNIFANETGDFTINIVYTGMFYEDIRNPKFTLEVLCKLIEKDSRIKFHFLGSGCEEIVSDYKEKIGENFILHGHRDREYASNSRFSADILMNISNNTLNQAPSKIVEYIGACKPIINFYSLDGDICKEILSEYPCSISIKEDWENIDSIVEEIYSFIVKNHMNKCDFAEIKQIYSEYLPETFANKIIDIIEDKT